MMSLHVPIGDCEAKTMVLSDVKGESTIPTGCISASLTSSSVLIKTATPTNCRAACGDGRKTTINFRAGRCSGIGADVGGNGLGRIVSRDRGDFGAFKRNRRLSPACNHFKVIITCPIHSDFRKRPSPRPTGPAVRVQPRQRSHDHA